MVARTVGHHGFQALMADYPIEQYGHIGLHSARRLSLQNPNHAGTKKWESKFPQPNGL